MQRDSLGKHGCKADGVAGWQAAGGIREGLGTAAPALQAGAAAEAVEQAAVAGAAGMPAMACIHSFDFWH